MKKTGKIETMKICDQNWPINFWNMWEEWEDDHQENMMRVFKTPGTYMRWTDQSNTELKHFTPWEFAHEFGANSLMDYLYYLANRNYGAKVSAEFLFRHFSARASFS